VRVLQINSVCGIGSTGRIATDIHALLTEKNHESYVAYGRDEPINCNSSIRIGNKFDNYLHVAKSKLLDMHGFGSKNATKQFIDKVKKIDPDVIHLHNIHGYFINVEMLFEFLKETNKPVIWTLHDCWPFTGHCSYFEYSGCECWKVQGNHKCIQKDSYPSSLLINNSKNNYERKRKAFTGVNNLTIITPSEWLANLVKESFLREYTVKVINNGIDLEVFKPRESNFREKYKLENKYIMLGVANVWSKRKGYEYFIELSKIISEDEIIILVGLTKSQIKNLPPNIIGISKTKNVADLSEIYSNVDIFINPTLEDNFPTTNLESLACGTPVITFNTGGSVESIDESCGKIVTQGDLNELIASIQELRMVKINEEHCIRRSRLYNKINKFGEYISLYSDVLLSSNSSNMKMK